jgi:hypothetical protein
VKNYLFSGGLLFLICVKVSAQQFVYVNTDKLLLRSAPDKTYTVSQVLHAGCKLQMEHHDHAYDNNKAVNARFYDVSFRYQQDDGTWRTSYGWVEKKYIVRSKSQITWPEVDTTVEDAHDYVQIIPYAGGERRDPNKYNYLDYPYPKYKGGEKVLVKPVKRKYCVGPRGGCYYMSPKGTKVYVDKHFCEGK